MPVYYVNNFDMEPESYFNIFDPFSNQDMCQLILYHTRGFRTIRTFFCVSKFFNKCMSSFYTISKVADPPCIVCHEKSDTIYPEFYAIFKGTRDRIFMSYGVKYYYDGVCEKCLHSATKRTCVNVKCNVQFMVRDGYIGENARCWHCSVEKTKDTFVLPEGFPCIINKITTF